VATKSKGTEETIIYLEGKVEICLVVELVMILFSMQTIESLGFQEVTNK